MINVCFHITLVIRRVVLHRLHSLKFIFKGFCLHLYNDGPHIHVIIYSFLHERIPSKKCVQELLPYGHKRCSLSLCPISKAINRIQSDYINLFPDKSIRFILTMMSCNLTTCKQTFHASDLLYFSSLIKS